MFHLAEFCRICLSKTNQLISIQHEDEDKVHISEKLLFINPSLIPFDFLGDDQYPKWVCVSCKKQINDAYYLLKKALDSSSVLDRLIKHVNTTNQPLNITGDIKDFVDKIPEEAPPVRGLKIRSITSINASVVKIKSVPKRVQIEPEEPDNHTCTICRKTFRNQVGFTVHKNWHKKLERSVPGIEYYCEYCELPPFKTLGALRRHADGHSSYFKRQKKLKQIEKELRGSEFDDLQTGPECGQCKRTFPTFRELNSHRRNDKHEIHKLYKPTKHP